MTHDHHHHHHDHHSHGPGAAEGDETLLLRAFVLIAGFMVVEFVGGLWSNSLTLLADAGHMFLDATALGMSWWAARVSRREREAHLSYGYHRFQVLAAFVNGLTLAVLVVWLLWEAAERLQTPEAMRPLPAATIAIAGFIINIIAYRWLHGDHHTANVRSAALHVLGDLLGSAAAIIAALTVYFTGWLYADPLLALVIALILARGAVQILKETVHILLEGVPKGIDLGEIRTALASDVPGVIEIHHVHAWALTAEKPLLTLHANVDQGSDLQQITAHIKHVLLERFGIDHSTIQVEHGPCPDES